MTTITQLQGRYHRQLAAYYKAETAMHKAGLWTRTYDRLYCATNYHMRQSWKTYDQLIAFGLPGYTAIWTVQAELFPEQ